MSLSILSFPLRSLATLGAVALATLSLPSFTQAGAARPLSCSVRVDYKVNGALRFPYAKEFVVSVDAPFEDDFSTFTRERFFTATARDAGEGRTVVEIGYTNDVGVFEYVDLGTSVSLRGDREETAVGTSSYFTSLGTAGEHTTDYALTCHRLKE